MRLGQHFLKNKNKISQIITALNPQKEDNIIEIGPGHGELTFSLLNFSPKSLTVIEKDKKLAADLKKINNKLLNVVEDDVLNRLPQLAAKTNKFKIIGNIPYYLTGYLLRIIGDLENKPTLIVFTTQKEVAKRITAEPPRMNLLAASVQFWAKPKIIGYISAKDFQPAPQVDSALIELKPKKVLDSNKNRENYYKFIKILFKQPRKTIINNLFQITRDKNQLQVILKNLNIKENARPQDLSLENIKKISSTIIKS